MKTAPTIYVDFQNADEDGFVRLNTNGTLADLEKAQLSLVDGLPLFLSDGELTAKATVREPGLEGVWRAEIDWGELKPANGEVKTFRLVSGYFAASFLRMFAMCVYSIWAIKLGMASNLDPLFALAMVGLSIYGLWVLVSHVSRRIEQLADKPHEAANL